MTKISLEISRTLNLGNFESLKVQVGMEDTLGPEETPDDGYRRLWEEVGSNLTEAIRAGLEEIQNLKEEAKTKPRTFPSRYRVPVTPE